MIRISFARVLPRPARGDAAWARSAVRFFLAWSSSEESVSSCCYAGGSLGMKPFMKYTILLTSSNPRTLSSLSPDLRGEHPTLLDVFPSRPDCWSMSILASILISFNSIYKARSDESALLYLIRINVPHSSTSWQIVSPFHGSAPPSHALLLHGSLPQSQRYAFQNQKARVRSVGWHIVIKSQKWTCSLRRSISSNNASTSPFKGSSGSSGPSSISSSSRVYQVKLT